MKQANERRARIMSDGRTFKLEVANEHITVFRLSNMITEVMVHDEGAQRAIYEALKAKFEMNAAAPFLLVRGRSPSAPSEFPKVDKPLTSVPTPATGLVAKALAAAKKKA